MLFTFLLVVQAVVAAILVGVILLQKSEGGGLTSGGSPAGLMSARGAADFLTRTTSVLATAFVALSIVLAVLAATRRSTSIDASLAQPAPAAPLSSGAPIGPVPNAENAPSAAAAAALAANNAAPAPNSAVPLEK